MCFFLWVIIIISGTGTGISTGNMSQVDDDSTNTPTVNYSRSYKKTIKDSFNYNIHEWNFESFYTYPLVQVSLLAIQYDQLFNMATLDRWRFTKNAFYVLFVVVTVRFFGFFFTLSSSITSLYLYSARYTCIHKEQQKQW